MNTFIQDNILQTDKI